jgi:hypothetical protein
MNDNSVHLEKIKFEVRAIIENDYLDDLKNIDARAVDDFYHNQTRIMLRQLLLAQKNVKYPTVSYPKTWWDGFKLACFPKYLLKRFPAEFTTVHFDVSIVYPQIELPRERSFVHVKTREETTANWGGYKE